MGGKTYFLQGSLNKEQTGLFQATFFSHLDWQSPPTDLFLCPSLPIHVLFGQDLSNLMSMSSFS